MSRYLAILTMLFATALGAQDTPPVETCGTDVPKRERELRARDCPEGFVGQWFQARAAGSCDWQPQEPQWFACAQQVEAQGPIEPPPITDPPGGG